MPIFRADDKLVCYAHVPKCGGSAVAWYLKRRFGRLAFNDRRHSRHDRELAWSRTSPQHIDAGSLSRLFPDGFFDATFTIVRHPVRRLVSAYHFQLEVERSISSQVTFLDWLEDLEDLRAENPFVYDNHVRPMSEIVPEEATVFHMEHSLDALVLWLDELTGRRDEPRALPKRNERGRHTGEKTRGPVAVGAPELEAISRIYAADFERFGYLPDQPRPLAPQPPLPDNVDAERETLQRTLDNPWQRVTRKLSRRIRL